jgi:WD40 repeat protein
MSSNFKTYLIQQHLQPQDASEIASTLLQNYNISDLAKLSLQQFYTLTSSIIKGKITQYVTWLACKEYYHSNELTTSISTTTQTTTVTSKKSHFAPYSNITSPFHVIELAKTNPNNAIVLEFNPNGKFLFVAIQSTIEIWSIPDYQRQFCTSRAEFGPDCSYISSISASPLGDVLAFVKLMLNAQPAPEDDSVESIVIWNIKTRATIRKLRKNYSLKKVQYNTSGSALAFMGTGGVGVHDTTNDAFPLLFVFEHYNIWPREICFVQMIKEAQEYFIYVTYNDVVCVNLGRGSTIAAATTTPTSHANQQLWIKTLEYARDSKIIFSVHHGLFVIGPQFFIHLDVENGKEIKRIRETCIIPYTVSVYESLIAIGRYDGSIEVWNIPEMTVINRWHLNEVYDGPTIVSFHPTGTWIGSAGHGGNQIKLWSE